MEEYSLIVLIDCWTSLEGFFVNKWSYWLFPRDVVAATLDDTNKSISLHRKLNPISCKFLKKNSIVLSFNVAALSRGFEPRISLRTLSAHIVITASILISALFYYSNIREGQGEVHLPFIAYQRTVMPLYKNRGLSHVSHVN